MALRRLSPSHGGVDRNRVILAKSAGGRRRPLTGAWIETLFRPHAGRLSARRPLTGAWIETAEAPQGRPTVEVALSRGRGSKHDPGVIALGDAGRPLTGAWIETMKVTRAGALDSGRPLTGAWIETPIRLAVTVQIRVALSRGRGSKRSLARRGRRGRGRPLTGAWIETTHPGRTGHGAAVALSRGRGSKPNAQPIWSRISKSPSHGGVDRNMISSVKQRFNYGRPLTGAWIETRY